MIFGVILIVLGYLGYQSLILNPKIAEANNEIFQAQDFFEKGLADEELRDSLFQNALSGANGKYGFSILLIIMAGHLQPIWRPTIQYDLSSFR